MFRLTSDAAAGSLTDRDDSICLNLVPRFLLPVGPANN